MFSGVYQQALSRCVHAEREACRHLTSLLVRALLLLLSTALLLPEVAIAQSARPAAPVVTAPANGASAQPSPTYQGVSDANLTITVYVDGSSIGTVGSSGSGTWSLAQPSALAAGSHTVYATATNSDGIVGPNSATNTFSVTPAPVANNYSLPVPITYNAGANTPTAFSIAGQTTNSPTSYAVGSTTTANGGTVSINNTGVVTYVAARGLRGNDSFTYTASNASGTSNVATVTILVGNPSLSATLSGSGTRNAPLSSVRIVPSGGTQPYSCGTTLASGTLPAGTQLNSDCSITGTPSVSGTFNFIANLTDSSTPPFTQQSTQLSLVVAAPSLSLSPAAGALPGATAGTSYSQSFSASGGVAPYGYAFTGTIPPGLSLVGNTLSGAPTQVGTFNFTVTATDSSQGSDGPYSASRSYSVTVSAPVIVIGPVSLSNGTVGIGYSQSLSASGGGGTYSYAATAGALPAGLTLSPTGTLSGVPTVGGSFTFTVTASDSTTGPSAPYSGSRSYTLTIAAPTITVAPATLPSATAGVAYSQAITASGGAGSYSYAVTAGTLPNGLTLSPTGALSGTPTAGGSFNFTITASDSSSGTGTSYSGSRAYALTVAAATIVVSPATLPNNAAGSPYNQTLSASGGNGSYSFAVTAGALPPGWTLSPAGVLSGTTTVANTSYTFTVTATDSSGGSGPYAGSRAYTVNITSPNFTLTSPTLSAAVGTPYSGTFVAGGGNAPYTYTRAAGTIPPGLTFASDGTLSGTPTSAGTYSFTVIARDSTTGPGSPFGVGSGYTFTVAEPPAPVADAVNVSVAYGSSDNSIPLALSGGPATSVAVSTPPSHGTVTVSGLTITYTPTAGYFGADSLSYTATNTGGTSAPATVSITVSTPGVPAAADVSGVTVAYDSPGTAIDLSGSITGVHSSVTVASSPAHGTISVSGDVVTYTPTTGYYGADSFSYTATGPGGTSAPATVTLQVAVPATPLVSDVSNVAVPYNSTGTGIDLSSAITGVHTSVAVGTNPAHGTVTISGDVVTYIPTTGYYGADSFSYTATGPGGTSTPATVTLQVAAPAAPAASDVSNVTVPYNSTGTAIDLSGAISGVHTSVTVSTNPAHGTVTVTGDVVTYTPTTGYYGADSFGYTATGPGGTSTPATVTLRVAVPAAPTVSDVANVAVPYNSSGTAIDLSSATSGVHTSVAIATNPAHGTVTVAGDVVTYIPTPGYFGSDSFGYTATGPGGTSMPATVTLQVAVPAPPTVSDVANVAVPYNSPGTAVDLSSAITGVHTGVSVSTNPMHGTVTVAGDVVTYVPTAGYFGSDSFGYAATGPGGTSTPATVTLQVAVPAAPTAVDRGGVAMDYNGAGTPIDLASDIAGAYTSVDIASPPTNGTASLSGTVVTYTPNLNYFGSDSFTYTVSGPGGTSRPVTVGVSIAPPPPPQVNDTSSSVPASTTTTGLQSVEINLTALVSGDFDRIEIRNQPTHGTVTLSGDLAARAQVDQIARAGRVGTAAKGPVIATYTPATGFVGDDSFTFVAIGPGGESSPALVGVQVLGQAPVAQAKTARGGDGQKVSVNLTEGASDGPFVGAAIVSLTPASQAAATIAAIGSGASQQYQLDVTPAARFDGTVVVNYTLTNAYGTSAPATVTITVTARPDPTTDPNIRAISDAQVESTRRFARSQVSNFMRRAEQLHGKGSGSGGADMGVRLNSRDRSMVQPAPILDASPLESAEGARSSTEGPASRRLTANGGNLQANRPDQLGMIDRGQVTASDRNNAAGLPGGVQPLAQNEGEQQDGARRNGSIGVWSGGAIEIGTQDETTDRSKITATTSGLSAGIDIKVADGITVGVGGGYGNDLIRIAGNAARVRVDSTMMAFYASLTPLEHGFIDVLAGRGDLSFRTRRRVVDMDAVASGRRDGDYTVLALAMGIDRQTDALQWSLYGRGEALDATLDSYAEDGAGRMNLRFDRRELTSITGTLGARLEYRQKFGFGIVTPRLRAEWSHEFADADAQRLDYSDVAGIGFYGIDTQGWSREQFQLSLGTRLLLLNLWSVDLETAFRGSSGQRSGSVRAQVSKEF